MPVYKNPIFSNYSDRFNPGPSIRLRGTDFKDQFATTSSFRYDDPNDPIKSTQQIPLDWSEFENHTFFGSAEVNVNVAFDNIINNFPFDGTPGEISAFIDSLTGFEKHVFDMFPKSLNTLEFRNGSYISVSDIAGGTIPDLSRVNDGSSILDPGAGSISTQFKIFLPAQANQRMTIFQRLSGSNGYSLFLDSTVSTTQAQLKFLVSSGSNSLTTSTIVSKNAWLDICAQFNRKPSSNRIFLFVDGEAVSSSSNTHSFLDFDTRGTSLIIGSGSRHQTTALDFLPQTTFSGTLDDFKIYHKARSQDEIKTYVSRSAVPSSDLRLYFKFNEPYGNYSQSSLIIDSSGFGLHSYVTNFNQNLKSSSNGRASFIERLNENPVLFPDYETLVDLNQELLASASIYDGYNPNLITKLVPKQYFLEGQASEGFETEEGPIADQYPSSGDLPKKSKLGSAQLLSSMLYIWAKQFDETKIFLDHFSKLESMEYVSTGSVASNFLQLQARNYGFELPKLFTPTSILNSDYGDDIGIDPSEGNISIKETQSQIWRRIVANLPDIVKNKGTIYSIKSLIRSFGVNPDTSLRIREYGGKTSGFIDGRKKRRESPGKLFATGSWLITSPYLSGSRIEPGAPLPKGTITDAGSTDPSDGLFTSGSWTWEGVYRYPLSRSKNETESLMRVYFSGSQPRLGLAVVAESVPDTYDGSANVYLYGAYNSSFSNAFVLPLTGSTLFDGERWQLSIGRNRKTSKRSEWFLRLGKSSETGIVSLHESILLVTASQNFDIFSNLSTALNRSGSYFVVGTEGSVSGSSTPLLGTDNYTKPLTGSFSGEISSIRFFTKYLDTTEWIEHVRNYESLGVGDPLKNFNFVTSESGSFERLRIDASFDQETIESDALGNITIFDYSQNNLHLTGSGFTASTTLIGYDDVLFSSLEPKFDERSTDEKVRIRSWSSIENVTKYGGEIAPVYEVPRYEQPQDDTRFGIEISVTKGLDEDIMNMFSDYTTIDNSIGNASDMFGSEYPDLSDLREVYFNRLTGNIDMRNIFLFSKWFEENIGNMIEQILPANTRFFGTNFVVESHVLERHKSKYYWGDMYLGENDRRDLRGSIGLNQIIAYVKRA